MGGEDSIAAPGIRTVDRIQGAGGKSCDVVRDSRSLSPQPPLHVVARGLQRRSSLEKMRQMKGTSPRGTKLGRLKNDRREPEVRSVLQQRWLGSPLDFLEQLDEAGVGEVVDTGFVDSQRGVVGDQRLEYVVVGSVNDAD